MKGNTPTYKLVIVAPTCFYYQAPLFRTLTANPRLDVMVYFCSDEGLSGKDVKTAYGAERDWGISKELLDGYKSKFLKNFLPWGSYLKSLVGLANFGIWRELERTKPDAVVVMSWMNPTWWLVLLACIRFKIPIFFMTDANVFAEQHKSLWKSWLKRLLLGKIIFRITRGFLCAGTANRNLYTYYGVPETKLIPFAYSWGYESLMRRSETLKDEKSNLRSQFNISLNSFVILYCGRLSPEKGLIELINAYKMIDCLDKTLVLVGDGLLKDRLTEFIKENGIKGVHFMGFQSRNEISKFYTISDLMVLPSHRETWGIVVNEALCFSLPVVVSDQVGAGVDLVMPNENGFVFPSGDPDALADKITKVMDLSYESRANMGKRSGALMKLWTDRSLGDPLAEYLDQIYEFPTVDLTDNVD